MKLHWKILIGMALGAIVGMLANDAAGVPGFSTIVSIITPIGQIFISLLKMLIVPLIIASMIMGVARVGDIRKLGDIGGKTFVFYILTTFASVTIGLIMVNIIQPGVGGSSIGAVAPDVVNTNVTVGQIILNMVPNNPIHAAANGQILPLIVFCLMLGAVLTTIGPKAKPLIDLFDSLNAAMMRLTDWVIKLTPIGVFALIAAVVANTGTSIFSNVGKYMLTVILGLAVHAMVVLPLILKFVGGVNPRNISVR